MILKNNLITLREYTKEDWENVHEYASIPEFTEFEAWGPNSIEDTKNFINSTIEQQKQNPRFEFNFAIEDNKTKSLIGGCGIRREGEFSSVANIGYAINPRFQNKGFATAAAKLILKFGFEQLKLAVIYATCDTRNIASFSVMSNCEMKRVGEFKGKRQFKSQTRDEYRYEILDSCYLS